MHLALLGDSIFDNARYVGGRPPVVDQVRGELPEGWQATLLAVDGNVVEDVARQLERLPADASHLALSVGGNDALGASGILREPTSTVGKAMEVLADVTDEFRREYHEMLRRLMKTGLPTVVCTIYDAIPGLGRAEKTALGAFNDMILREAFAAAVPVVDLRLICTQASDYASWSPIEPSHVGGAKIAHHLAKAVTSHPFDVRRTYIYGSD